MTIISPDVAEEELQGTIDNITSIVTNAGGAVTLINREAPWGRRRLSYPIRHTGRDVRDGFYALFYVEIDAAKLIEVERDIKLTDSIMRYLVTQQVAPAMIPASELEAAAAAEAAADAQEAEVEAAMEAAAAAAAAPPPVVAPAAPVAEADETVAATESEADDVVEETVAATAPEATGGVDDPGSEVGPEAEATEETSSEETSSADDDAGDDSGDKS